MAFDVQEEDYRRAKLNADTSLAGASANTRAVVSLAVFLEAVEEASANDAVSLNLSAMVMLGKSVSAVARRNEEKQADV